MYSCLDVYKLLTKYIFRDNNASLQFGFVVEYGLAQLSQTLAENMSLCQKGCFYTG